MQTLKKQQQQKEQLQSQHHTKLPSPPFSFRDLAIPCVAFAFTWLIGEISNDSKSPDFCFQGSVLSIYSCLKYWNKGAAPKHMSSSKFSFPYNILSNL